MRNNNSNSTKIILDYFKEHRVVYQQLINLASRHTDDTKPVTLGQMSVFISQYYKTLNENNDLLQALVLGTLNQEQRTIENEKDLEKLRTSLLETVSALRNIAEKVDKISDRKQMVNRIIKLEKRLQQFEKETKPVITSIKNTIDKKVEEQKSLGKGNKVNFDFFQ